MDFHCHLDLYPSAREVYLEASHRNEFTWLVTTSPKAFAATSRVLPPLPAILITPGLHPEIAHERAGELTLLLEQMATVSAIGEVGLDGSARFRTHYAAQQRVFSSVVSRCAELGGRTLSIHSRQAVKDVLAELRRNPGFGTAVLHWFTGTTAELHTADQDGCWFSVGPAMLASANGRALAARMPRDRIVPESDGPFAKINGKPVMPWCEKNTIQSLANIWSLAEEDVRRILNGNSKRLLSIMGVE